MHVRNALIYSKKYGLSTVLSRLLPCMAHPSMAWFMVPSADPGGAYGGGVVSRFSPAWAGLGFGAFIDAFGVSLAASLSVN